MPEPKTMLHWAGMLCTDHSCIACTDRDKCEPYQALFAVPADIMDIAREMATALEAQRKAYDAGKYVDNATERPKEYVPQFCGVAEVFVRAALARAREAGIEVPE